MVDYLQYSNAFSVGRIRPHLDLDKPFKINSFTVRLRSGYELFLYTDFTASKPYAARGIDRSRLRIEIALQPNPHLVLTPFSPSKLITPNCRISGMSRTLKRCR
ncbi:hypothetical protein AHMF7616_03335 [Adhaeribacter pallidiroseus]|uniref:Uncharacterized protein n=1 Tax=Adhaeribacter pallidiroseus TaxID=2072847 RepID=A0A369QPE1_9BACT|nr:hypothetical protein AHMF7616_03335 [Adhaeribacter pallidiroseus]